MKKLIAALAAFAGALGLHAVDTGTGFEIQLPDGATSTNYVDVLNEAGDELAGGTPSQYWDLSGATLEDDGLLVKAYGSETKYGGKQGETGSQKFPAPNSSDNTNYLAISTSSGTAVTRYATSGGSSVAINKSFYFDSLVKFTAFETNKLADVVLADGGKLAIWLQADEIDPDTLEPMRTNLVVSAGYLRGGGADAYSAVPTNYLCSVSGIDVADGEWHRVSVKAIDTISSAETVPGFVIAIDGKLVAITNNIDGYTGFADIGAIDPAGIPQRVKKFYQTKTGYPKNNLFPSVFATSEGLNASITSVSFAGVGSVDDLVFTGDNDVDALEDAADTGIFTFNFGANIGAAKYSIGGAAPVSISNGDTVPYAGGTLEVTILDIEPAAGYLVGGVVGEDGAAVVDNGDGTYTVTVTADLKAVTINAIQAGANVTGAATGNGYYETAAEVFDKISDGTITPAGTITVTLAQNASEGVYLDADGVSVTLDLAGKTIEGIDTVVGGATIYLVAGSLTITNSTADIGRVDPLDPSAYAVGVEGGTLAIGGGFYDGAIEASNAAAFTITDGSFLASAVELYGTFDVMDEAVKEVLGDDYGLAQEGDYYVVQSSITSYNVTFIDPEAADPVVISRNENYVLQVADIPSLAGKVGYDSTGWATNGVTVEPVGIVVTEALTFTAVYTGKSFTIVTYTNGVENTTTNFTYDSETASAIVPAIEYNSSTEEWDGEFYESDGMTPFSFAVAGELTQYAYATITEKSGGLDPEHGTTDVHSTALNPADAEADAKDNITVPSDAAGAVTKADYANYFKYGVTGTAGDYTVSITGIVESVENTVAESAVSSFTNSTTANVDVPAGLYYRITPYASLPIPTDAPSSNGWSNGSVAIDPARSEDGSKGFIKIELNASPIQ